MKTIKSLLLLSIILSFVPSISADTVNFTYNTSDQPYKLWGTSRKETYDIAIHVNTPAMVGKKVVEIRVPVHGAPESFGTISGWISSALQLSGTQNAPDIMEVEANLEPISGSGDYLLRAIFPTPYEITSEGVFVGYTLDVKSLTMATKLPIAVVNGASQGAFWIHTSKTSEYGEWTAASNSLDMMSSMVVVMEGTATETAASISLDDIIYAVTDEATPMTFGITNIGSKSINDIDVSYMTDNVCYSDRIQLETPLLPGTTQALEISVYGPATTGDYTFKMAFNKINGITQPEVWTSTKLKSLSFIPVNRPLVEEFTGLNCQYCPEGYVAMEEMNRDYGDLFVALSYHVPSYEKGAMVTTTRMPVENVEYYPSVAVNRGKPYSPADLNTDWNNHRKIFVPMDINTEAWFTTEDKAIIEAEATVTFAETPPSGNYKVAFCLVADGLHNDSWVQANYYAGMESLKGEFWDIFTQGGSKIRGLTYNFVVASFDDMFGIEPSLPSEITVGEPYKFRYEFDMKKVRNIRNEEFINSDATLRVVGIVLDSMTGKAINCNSSAIVTSGAGMSNPEKNGHEISSIKYFDLSGLPLSGPAEGPYIMQEVYSDGIVKTSKIMRCK